MGLKDSFRILSKGPGNPFGLSGLLVTVSSDNGLAVGVDDEVRTAYRKMAMKNHPDKVATLGPDVEKAAAEIFRQVQEAYETIKKERGMN